MLRFFSVMIFQFPLPFEGLIKQCTEMVWKLCRQPDKEIWSAIGAAVSFFAVCSGFRKLQ